MRKVFAYITHTGRLLLFRHTEYPESGIQVPGGTVAGGEQPEVAVLREAFEETGLAGLELDLLLGETVCAVPELGPGVIHHRYYYHLRCTEDPPHIWRHWERDASDGSPPIEFELFWVSLADGLPQLLPAHAAMLPKLLERLGL